MTRKPRFKAGDRVKHTGCWPDVPYGATGTVAEVATGKGKSVYPDPMKLMVFVAWDAPFTSAGVMRHQLERLP